VGDAGQRVNWMINFCSSSPCDPSSANYQFYTPWIYSAATFDLHGNPQPLHQVFPTYSIYQDSKFQSRDEQTGVNTFIFNYTQGMASQCPRNYSHCYDGFIPKFCVYQSTSEH
jgi:hypothetical protein